MQNYSRLITSSWQVKRYRAILSEVVSCTALEFSSTINSLPIYTLYHWSNHYTLFSQKWTKCFHDSVVSSKFWFPLLALVEKNASLTKLLQTLLQYLARECFNIDKLLQDMFGSCKNFARMVCFLQNFCTSCIQFGRFFFTMFLLSQ